LLLREVTYTLLVLEEINQMTSRKIFLVFALSFLLGSVLFQFPLCLEQAAAQSKAPKAVNGQTPKGHESTVKGKISTRAKITEHIEYAWARTPMSFTLIVSLEIRNGTSETIKVKHPFELICENGKRVEPSHLAAETYKKPGKKLICENGKRVEPSHLAAETYIKPGKSYKKVLFFDLLYSDISSIYTLTSKTEGLEPIKLSDPDPPKPL
jgi:hypothetical protein